jgi:hypothetical protein
VGYSRRQMHTVVLLQEIDTSLDKDASPSLDYGDSLTETMKVIRQDRSGAETGDPGAELLSTAFFGDKSVEFDSSGAGRRSIE